MCLQNGTYDLTVHNQNIKKRYLIMLHRVYCNIGIFGFGYLLKF